MKRLDRYILTEMLGPFLFGIGAFLAILVGVQLLYEMLRMIYQAGFPACAAVRIFLLEIPGMIALTLPMATMFGSLMAIGRLSSDGELVAMRAGGISVFRVGAPIIVFGLLVSVGGLLINESIVPPSKKRAFEIARQARATAGDDGGFLFQIRNAEGQTERILYADEIDPETLEMRNVFVFDFTLGERPELFTATSARWQGEQWHLENVEHTWWLASNRSVQVSPPEATITVGRSREEVEQIRKGPDDMTLGELAAQTRTARKRGDLERANRLWMHYHVRLALPWASLGFAVLGVGLGIQRQRSSRGIGMGVSLLVIFVYYVITHTLSLVGERGVAHPALMAWTANVLLYLTGVGLLLNRSR